MWRPARRGPLDVYHATNSRSLLSSPPKQTGYHIFLEIQGRGEVLPDLGLHQRVNTPFPRPLHRYNLTDILLMKFKSFDTYLGWALHINPLLHLGQLSEVTLALL
jgi:hypothetical protein